MLNIVLLSEQTADCIFVTVGPEAHPTHILIDGGLTADQGDLVKFCQAHFDQGKVIDLVILSHVDGDHIGGLLHLFKQDFVNSDFIKKVWFNSKYPVKEAGGDSSKLDITYAQGNTLAQLIKGKKIETCPIVASATSNVVFNGLCEIRVLAPSPESIEQLLSDWPDEAKLDIAAERGDHLVDWDTLRTKEYTVDGSKKNRSSVVVLIHCITTGKKALLTGDSIPPEILNFVDAAPEEVDLVKLPHHGSKKNISSKLIQKFPSKRILTTAGAKDLKPHKKSIQLLIDNLGSPFEIYVPHGNWVAKNMTSELAKYGCAVRPYRSRDIIKL